MAKLCKYPPNERKLDQSGHPVSTTQKDVCNFQLDAYIDRSAQFFFKQKETM
jgi:hypothetical protein